MAKTNGVGGHVRFDWLTYSGGSYVPTWQTFCVERWALNLTNETQDVTTTCGNGWVDRIAGYSSGTIDVSFFVDYATLADPAAEGTPATAFPNVPQYALFAPGQRVFATLRIGGPGKTATTFHEIEGWFIVSGMNIENPAKNPVKFTLQGESANASDFAGVVSYVGNRLGDVAALITATGTQVED